MKIDGLKKVNLYSSDDVYRLDGHVEIAFYDDMIHAIEYKDRVYGQTVEIFVYHIYLKDRSLVHDFVNYENFQDFIKSCEKDGMISSYEAEFCDNKFEIHGHDYPRLSKSFCDDDHFVAFTPCGYELEVVIDNRLTGEVVLLSANCDNYRFYDRINNIVDAIHFLAMVSQDTVCVKGCTNSFYVDITIGSYSNEK